MVIAARSAFVAIALAVVACGGPPKKTDSSLANTGGTTADTGGASTAASTPAGDARVIQRTQSAGTIELQGDRSLAMQRAQHEMADHCGPDNFVITQEGEEAVAPDGGGAGRTATAWRVYYQCNGAQP